MQECYYRHRERGCWLRVRACRFARRCFAARLAAHLRKTRCPTCRRSSFVNAAVPVALLSDFPTRKYRPVEIAPMMRCCQPSSVRTNTVLPRLHPRRRFRRILTDRSVFLVNCPKLSSAAKFVARVLLIAIGEVRHSVYVSMPPPSLVAVLLLTVELTMLQHA